METTGAGGRLNGGAAANLRGGPRLWGSVVVVLVMKGVLVVAGLLLLLSMNLAVSLSVMCVRKVRPGEWVHVQDPCSTVLYFLCRH
jgi:hypothetical protein